MGWDPQRLTENAGKAIQQAQRDALSRQHQQVTPTHLLLALVRQPEGVVPGLLERLGADVAGLVGDLERDLEQQPRVSGAAPQYAAPELSAVLERAAAEAERLRDEYVSTEHLLLAIADPETTHAAGEILRRRGGGREALLGVLAKVRGGARVTDERPEEKYEALARYTQDLTA
jgi:ATP-dependent Clp protease ATP-binding subunit ClpB